MEAALVALITALPPTLVAIAAFRLGGRSASTLGRSNGQGTVTEMLERLVLWTESHDREHGHLMRAYDAEQAALRRRLDAMDGDNR